MKSILTVIPRFLRDPQSFFDSIRRGEEVKAKVLALSISAISFLAIYGFTLGLSHSFLQALSSAVKMPLILIATVAFCLPALHFFSLAVLNTPLSLLQVTAVVLSGVGVTAFLLLGLSPVMLFFVLTSENYPFFQMLTVIFVALSGCLGLYFLWRGMTQVEAVPATAPKWGRSVLGIWLVLYMFVSTQMTWRLSPLVGDPDQPFVLLQPSHDNFYVDALNAFQRTLGIVPASGSSPQAGLASSGMLMLIALIFALGVITGALFLRNRRSPARYSPTNAPAANSPSGSSQANL